MRYACNHRLRNALYHWGRVSAQHDPSTRRHYRALRQRGHGHARAIRGVIDRLLVVLMAMLRTGTTYDPADRKSTRLNSSHLVISYAVFCLKKKKDRA